MSRAHHIPFVPSGGKARRDARRVDRALRRAGTYPHPAGRIRRTETHLSVVFLAGRYAYKLFKPVKLDFADLTRLARAEPLSATERTLAIRFDTGGPPAADETEAFWTPLLDALARRRSHPASR